MIKKNELAPGTLVFDSASCDEAFEVILLLGAVVSTQHPSLGDCTTFEATMLNHMSEGRYTLTEEPFEGPNESYEALAC